MRALLTLVAAVFHLALALAWIALLGVLPWWCAGLLLLATEVLALVWPRVSARRFEQWPVFYALLGLAGLAIALARALGDGMLAWIAAVGAVFVLFLLKAALERRCGLPRGRDAPTSAGAGATPAAHASQRPTRSASPPPSPIALEPPSWLDASEQRSSAAQPRYLVNGEIRFGPPTGDYLLPELAVVIGWAGARYALSADGRWFVASQPGGRPGACDYLYDRRLRRLYELSTWQLRGWAEDGPWLAANDGAAPRPLAQVADAEAGDDYLPLRDLWLPRRFVASLPLARQAWPAPEGPHVATLDLDLPESFAPLDDPLDRLRRPYFRLAVDGLDSGLLSYGLSGQPWDAAGRELRVFAWPADAARAEPQAWRWSVAEGWRRDDGG